VDQLKTQETVAYDKNQQEVTVRSKKKRIEGTFSAVGKLSTMKEDRDDIFDLLDRVSKRAFHLFNELKTRRNENNNLVVYPTCELSKTQRETFSRQLKELREVNLVRIAKRQMAGQDLRRPYVTDKQTYMLNPELLKCWNYKDAALLWDQCKP
jgi:hypothetical protein